MIRFLRSFSAATFAISAAAASAQPLDGPPNILLVLLDDAGYMDFGAYGGDTATPNIDALADRGTKFSRFYMSPQCGPSRGMLLTGRDNHEIGLGSITETLPPDMKSLPAYSMKLADDQPTIASRLRDAGYQTFVTGKWGVGDIGANLPHRYGFDRSFVIDATGGSNYDHTSYLPLYDETYWYEDGERVTLPENFYSSEGIVDKMIDYLGGADPDRPFFSYVSFQAIHVPIQVSPEFRDRYDGRFDQGWEVMREERLERAISMGLVPESTRLAPLPETSRDWDDLAPQDKAYWARMMQVNAGMLEAADHHLGRLLAHLEASGKLENTIVIVTSDNGPESAVLANREGIAGLLVDHYWMGREGWEVDYETLGGRNSLAAIGEEWASVSAAPFALFKFTATEGGMRVPLIMAGPGVEQVDIQPGRAHVFDIAPTLLEAAGLDPDKSNIRGRSLVPVISGDAATVYGADDAIGFEVSGNAALYRGNWKISLIPEPLGDGKWHLYDLANDAGETTDLAMVHPALLQDMLNEYRSYASEVGVVDMATDFNPVKQLSRNAFTKTAKENWLLLALFGVALLAVVFLVGRAFRRPRRA